VTSFASLTLENNAWKKTCAGSARMNPRPSTFPAGVKSGDARMFAATLEAADDFLAVENKGDGRHATRAFAFAFAIVLIWDRCYAFKNICAEKFGEKNGVFNSNKAKLFKKIDHNIGF
jgi:hypothetical protein